MIEKIISALVGFVAGCTLSDLLKKTLFPKDEKKKESFTSQESKSRDAMEMHRTPLRTPDEIQKQEKGFSLQSINEIFSDYHIELINSGSLNVLLRKIKNESYKNLLKKFIDQATTPEKLVQMLKEDSTPAFNVNIKATNQAPFISDEELNNYIAEEGAAPNSIETREDKIRFLLTINYTRGIELFKNTLGFYLTDILENSERGADITELYEKIMGMIKSRYGYIS